MPRIHWCDRFDSPVPLAARTQGRSPFTIYCSEAVNA